MACLAEHFLQPERDLGGLAGVVDRDRPAERSRETGRRRAVERPHPVPADPGLQRFGDVERGDVGGGADLAEIWQQPVPSLGEKGFVGAIGQVGHEGHAGEQPPCAGGHRQAEIADALQRGGGQRLVGGVLPVAVVEDDGAKALLPPGNHTAFALRPFGHVVPLARDTGRGPQLALADRHRQADARVAALALDIGHNDEALAGEVVFRPHLRPAPAGEQEARRVAGAAQPDTVGVGERQGLCLGEIGGGACEPGEASGLVGNALQRRASGVGGGAGVVQRAPALCEVGPGTAERVALFEQGRKGGGRGAGESEHMA